MEFDRFKLLVGDKTAEEIKFEICSGYAEGKNEKMERRNYIMITLGRFWENLFMIKGMEGN